MTSLQGYGGRGHDIACSIMAAIYFVSFILMAITTIIVTKSDPTDPTVALERLARLAKKHKMGRINFNANDYEFHCDACDTHVLKNTKHCQRCNRCSYEFDHHCVWVSNDIGLHNYIEFIRMLSSVMATIVSQIVFSAYSLFYLYDLPDEVKIGFSTKEDLLYLVWTTLALVVCLFVLDTYLLSFHIFLISKNTTTYKHIRKGIKRKSRVIREKAP